MYITDYTSTTLTLKANAKSKTMFSWFLNVLLSTIAGMPFLLSGVFVITVMGRSEWLTCDRLEPTQVTCKVSFSTLFTGLQVRSIPLVQRAEVEVSEGDDSRTYRVVLITKTGQVPLTERYSSGSDSKYQTVEKINEFIHDPTQLSLRIKQDNSWFAYIFGVFFILLGGNTVLSPFMESLKMIQTACVVNKTSGYLYLTQKNSLKSVTKQIRLSDVQSAEVIEKTDGDGDTTYYTQVNLRSGEVIPLDIDEGSQNHHDVVKSINSLLENPY